jgi:hypothetical protein
MLKTKPKLANIYDASTEQLEATLSVLTKLGFFFAKELSQIYVQC